MPAFLALGDLTLSVCPEYKLHLQLFSDRLLQRLVVGDLQDDCGHLLSELFFQLGRCRFGVFDCVVQQGCVSTTGSVIPASFASTLASATGWLM